MPEKANDGFVLDEAAMDLFRELEGIDNTNRLKPLGDPIDEAGEWDDWRILLW